MSDLQAKVDMLEKENDILRERVISLEAEMTHKAIPPIFGFTGSENRLLGMLLKRTMVTRESAMVALYGDDMDRAADAKIIDVFICKMRAKLKPFQIEITTHWATGYSLTAETKAHIHKLFSEVQA